MRYLELLETLESRPVKSDEWYSTGFAYTLLHLIDCRIDGTEVDELMRGLDAAEFHFALGATSGQPAPTLRAIAQHFRAWMLGEGADALMMALLDHVPYLVDEELWQTVRSIADLTLLLGAESPNPNIEWRAYRTRAMSHRFSGELTLASVNYEAGAEAARRGGLEEGTVANEAGLAIVTRHRGNLPAAEAQIRALVVRADQTGVRELITFVRGELAIVLGERQQFEECLLELNRALFSANARERERIAGNIAHVCFLTGHLDAARGLYVTLSTCAKSAGVRFISRANNIRIAAIEMNLGEVERLRTELEFEDCTVMLRITYLLALGSSYAALGERVRAEEVLCECVKLSTEFGIGQRLMDAERELAHVKRLSRLNLEVEDSAEFVDAIVDNACRSLVE